MLTLYRFAVVLTEDDCEARTLALIPAENDTAAFTAGCDMVGEDARRLAAKLWQCSLCGARDAAFFVHEVDSVDDAREMGEDAAMAWNLLREG